MDTTAATMDLLDLPLEVFYMIVYRYIMLWGLVGIMPLLASEPFRTAVYYNLVNKVPLRVFHTSPGRKFFKEYFGTILAARTRQARLRFTRSDPSAEALSAEHVHGVYPFLARYINRVLNHVYELANRQDISGDLRGRHIDNICKAIVHHYKYAMNLEERKVHYLMLHNGGCDTNQFLIKGFNRTFGLAVVAATAVVTGDYNFLCMISEQEDMWQASSSFGSPFNAAVSSGNDNIVRQALNSVRNLASPPDGTVVEALINGVGTSLDQGRVPMAREILRAGSIYFPRIDAWLFKIWLDKAVALEDVFLLNSILGLNQRAGKLCLSDAFLKACKNGQHNVLRAFFGIYLLQINEPLQMHRAPVFPAALGPAAGLTTAASGADFYPLMAVIRNAPSGAGCHMSVTALLGVGADPNGLEKPGNYASASQFPFAVAAKKQYWDTVMLLLNDKRTELEITTQNNAFMRDWLGVLEDIDDHFSAHSHMLQDYAWEKLDDALESSKLDAVRTVSVRQVRRLT